MEVVLALGILGIALLPIIQLTVDSNYRVKEARQLTEAVNLARRQLEVQRSKNFGQLRTAPKSKLLNTNYNYLVKVKPKNSKLKQVTVKVKYKGEVKSKLTTIVRKGE